MNVNCKVSLTDEQRNKMVRSIFGSDSKRMITRHEVNEFVQKKIQEVLNGGTETHRFVPEHGQKSNIVKVTSREEQSGAYDFTPSRGDEPYIFKAKDESLRAIHSRMLDCIEEYEAAVWKDIEKNRKTV